MHTQPWTTPLSPEERADFRHAYEKRLAKVEPKMEDVFAFREVAQPPFIVNSAMYWVFGLDLDTFPAEYFDDPAVMTAFQERTYYEQIKEIDDDFVPYLMPWFGTVVAASALGCVVEFPPKQDPAVNPSCYPVKSAEDVNALRIPDPDRDGLMPRVLDCMRYMKANSFLPVGITDFQGPLTTANQLMGYDKLIYLMHDHPAAAHQLMDKITETLIMWGKVQKAMIGEAPTCCAGNQQVYLGSNAGIWFSDDDAVLMSSRIYREFVVPYNSRLLRAFGGGCLHFCGNGAHQAENFLETEGLLAINNYMLHNTAAFHRLKRKLEGRIVMFACDYTPLEYAAYFDQLLTGMSRRGLVVHSQYSPVVCLLKGGKYSATRRDLYAGRKAVFECLRDTLSRHSGSASDDGGSRPDTKTAH